MRQAGAWVVAVVLLAGCGEKDTARQQAEDAADVAMVERLSKEPLVPMVPKAITAQDVARYGLDKPGCSFRKNGEGEPLFIAAKDEGFLRIEGELKRYAAKGTSADLPGGARSTYVGLASWVDLVRQPDAGGALSDDLNWPARMILHDAQERVAFMADGTMTCRT